MVSLWQSGELGKGVEFLELMKLVVVHQAPLDTVECTAASVHESRVTLTYYTASMGLRLTTLLLDRKNHATITARSTVQGSIFFLDVQKICQ